MGATPAHMYLHTCQTTRSAATCITRQVTVLAVVKAPLICSGVSALIGWVGMGPDRWCVSKKKRFAWAVDCGGCAVVCRRNLRGYVAGVTSAGASVTCT